MDLTTLPTAARESEVYSHSDLLALVEQCKHLEEWNPVDSKGRINARKSTDVDDNIVAMVLRHFGPSVQSWADERNLALTGRTTARNPTWAKAGARVAPTPGTICLIIPYPDTIPDADLEIRFEPLRNGTDFIKVDWQFPKLLPVGSVLTVARGDIKFLPIEIHCSASGPAAAPGEAKSGYATGPN
ncbi:hypothetical protein PCL_08634 [Purpureocillium lilacinum]|uniref:Uncharacterized protein n=1 Tax=Purpureocillium lilacinum TaxID=33203 RepID=A0A2U3DR33_PURLI|nr:hypothetical protein PCL_08634 [Purpureocillium lilacinum]